VAHKFVVLDAMAKMQQSRRSRFPSATHGSVKTRPIGGKPHLRMRSEAFWANFSNARAIVRRERI